MTQAGLATLPKTLLRIHGPDATRFINGLVTSRLLPDIVKKKQHTISAAENTHRRLSEIINVDHDWGLMHEDIYDETNTIHVLRAGINSMFLNSKGRVVTDCFIYADPYVGSSGSHQPSFVIEVDNSVSSKLQMLLRLHKLASKVQIDVVDAQSHYYYCDTQQFDGWLEELQERYLRTNDPDSARSMAQQLVSDGQVFLPRASILGFAVDNRIPNFGIKFLTQNLQNPFSDTFKSTFLTPVVGLDEVCIRRYTNGVLETADVENGSLLPFECNLDFTNGLSLDKGCYVGQELTIRTFNNGTIRKRAVPVQFFDLKDQPDGDQPQYNAADLVVDQLAGIDLGSLTVTRMDGTDTSDEAAAASPFGASKAVRKRKLGCGKVVARSGNVGMALMNLGEIEHQDVFRVSMDADGREIGLRTFVPGWWPA